MYEPVVLADPVSRLKKSLVEPVALLAPAPVPKKLLLFDSKYGGWTGNAPVLAPSPLSPAPPLPTRLTPALSSPSVPLTNWYERLPPRQPRWFAFARPIPGRGGADEKPCPVGVVDRGR
jgi:hypothetical protein